MYMNKFLNLLTNIWSNKEITISKILNNLEILTQITLSVGKVIKVTYWWLTKLIIKAAEALV
jgi:hypothetical protein